MIVPIYSACYTTIMSLNNKKKEAFKLRKNGLSYNKILQELNLKSKGTLSYWFKDLVLSSDEKEKLIKNYKLSTKRGLARFNKERSKKIKKQNKDLERQGKIEVLTGQDKNLLILGASLYWGEGTKYIGNYPSLIFTNSDPDMIKSYMKFLRKGLKIKEERIKAGIHLHTNIQEQEARRFWSQISNLPQDIFYIVKIISSASKNKRLPKKIPYGMVVIKVNHRQTFYRVKGMIEGLKEIK
ncbi:MAG: hypothetical protein WDZ73_00860 [Candidatus Paceibacterota bacterium]